MAVRDDLLHLYLRDHLAGATGGRALARRLADLHRGKPGGRELADFTADVERDRESLQAVMASVGVRPDPTKAVLAVVGERLGRLKANGRLWRRSPLSTVIELEMMRMGVEGKASGWRTLREVAEHDARFDRHQLDELVARAEVQAALLERLRVQAVTDTLTD